MKLGWQNQRSLGEYHARQSSANLNHCFQHCIY
jgi:hypothetical protein